MCLKKTNKDRHFPIGGAVATFKKKTAVKGGRRDSPAFSGGATYASVLNKSGFTAAASAWILPPLFTAGVAAEAEGRRQEREGGAGFVCTELACLSVCLSFSLHTFP